MLSWVPVPQQRVLTSTLITKCLVANCVTKRNRFYNFPAKLACEPGRLQATKTATLWLEGVHTLVYKQYVMCCTPFYKWQAPVVNSPAVIFW